MPKNMCGTYFRLDQPARPAYGAVVSLIQQRPIIRLRKLQLDTSLSSLVEEAAQLLARERRIEAEAQVPR